MVIKMIECDECEGRGEAYCPDCQDDHRCQDCNGIGFESENKIYCTYKGERMHVVVGSEDFLWLKHKDSKDDSRWDIAVNRSGCSNLGDQDEA